MILERIEEGADERTMGITKIVFSRKGGRRKSCRNYL